MRPRVVILLEAQVFTAGHLAAVVPLYCIISTINHLFALRDVPHAHTTRYGGVVRQNRSRCGW